MVVSLKSMKLSFYPYNRNYFELDSGVQGRLSDAGFPHFGHDLSNSEDYSWLRDRDSLFSFILVGYIEKNINAFDIDQLSNVHQLRRVFGWSTKNDSVWFRLFTYMQKKYTLKSSKYGTEPVARFFGIELGPFDMDSVDYKKFFFSIDLSIGGKFWARHIEMDCIIEFDLRGHSHISYFAGIDDSKKLELRETLFAYFKKIFQFQRDVDSFKIRPFGDLEMDGHPFIIYMLMKSGFYIGDSNLKIYDNTSEVDLFSDELALEDTDTVKRRKGSQEKVISKVESRKLRNFKVQRTEIPGIFVNTCINCELEIDPKYSESDDSMFCSKDCRLEKESY